MHQLCWRVVSTIVQWPLFFWEHELLLSKAESLDSFESLSQPRYFQDISRMMFLNTSECVSFDLEGNWCLYWNQKWYCIGGLCSGKFPFPSTQVPWSNTLCSLWGMKVFSAMLLSVVWKQRIWFWLSFACQLEICKKGLFRSSVLACLLWWVFSFSFFPLFFFFPPSCPLKYLWFCPDGGSEIINSFCMAHVPTLVSFCFWLSKTVTFLKSSFP